MRNNGKKDYSVLKWRTPLDGLRSNCLAVDANGKKLQYDGIYTKRSAPSPDQYLLVKPGQTVSSTFDVSDAYDMTKAGLYSMAVDTYLEYVMGSVIKKPVIQSNIAHLKSSSVSYEIVDGSFMKRTLGQRTRSLERSNEIHEESLTREGLDVEFDRRGEESNEIKYSIQGGSKALRDETEVAILAANTKIKSAIQDIENNPKRAKIWFGKTAIDAKNVFVDMKRKLARKEMIYIFNGKKCEKDMFAYTYLGSRKIFFCKAFNKAETLVGFDTKAGIIIHELSHALTYTDDITYGQHSCKKLAKKKAKKAVKNADNYEYYVESAPNL